jgi:hypothetical protein
MAIGTASAGQVAQFLEINGTQDFSIISGGGTTFFNGSSQVFFSFSNTIPPSNPLPGIRQATLTWNASSTTIATDDAVTISQSGFSGTFSIIDNLLGTNLLSGAFGPFGTLSGPSGGTSATFSDSIPPVDEVTFTSAYLDFTLSTTQAFALSLSNLNPGLSLLAGMPVDATAAGTGTFSADPLPTSHTPEPASMALMGSALVAVGLFGRKKVARR